ncbi:hypothetical protein POM88_026342 [Heracleum sosnowskyi]|uniref:Uncharacterized protein n=1 Tax=Heracleum sosnowskyi TaxID=360622 RepID=A0AAD8I6B2_9APIA|nr:hypothetical protein POM88_026342 [Heracleum sosnowskyi]
MNIHWFPPPPGTIKVNVHGGISSFPFLRGNASTVGVILRDEEGSLLCNLLGTIPNMNSAAEAIQLWGIYNGMCNTTSIYLAHLGGKLDRLYFLNVVSVGDLDEYLAMDMDLLGDFNVGLDIDNEDEEVVNFPKAEEILPEGAGIMELHHAILEDEIID